VLLALGVGLALLGVGAWYASPELVTKIASAVVGEQFHAPERSLGLGGSGPWARGYPPRGVEAQTSPLGQPALPSPANDSYSFTRGGVDGSLAAYDPCRPLHSLPVPTMHHPAARS